MLIKVQFLKNDKPHVRAYTYDSGEFDVAVGDKVTLPNGKGIVTSVDVPKEEVAAFRDKIKAITGKVEENDDN